VLTLLEFRQEPGLLTLLLEALERALERLVGLDNDFGHAAPPSAIHGPRWINDNYIPSGDPLRYLVGGSLDGPLRRLPQD
jgi:hypothetical protein